MTVAIRTYPSGNFGFTLDGARALGFVRSVEGGNVKGAVINELIGPDNHQFKHLSNIQVEPISAEIGLSMSKAFFDWIKMSWNKQYSRKNGAITFADFNFRARHEQSFLNALITETTFPVLDGSEKKPGYLTIKIQPEKIELKKSNNQRVQGEFAAKQKLWSPSNFEFTIDGVNTTGVNRVESFTVKQKVHTLYFGAGRHPEIEPTGIEFPNLIINCSTAQADDFIKWHDEFVVKGRRDTTQEKNGSIKFKSHNQRDTLLTVKLQNIGICGLSTVKAQANEPKLKRVKIEMYVEKMDLEEGSGVFK